MNAFKSIISYVVLFIIIDINNNFKHKKLMDGN